MGKQVPKYLSPFVAVTHFVITHLPFKMAYFLMGFVLSNGGQFFVKQKNMRKNIREIFPDLDKPAVEALTKKILASFGHHIAEIFHITSFKEGTHGLRIEYTTPQGQEFDGTGPAVYVGAHVGSWELGPLIFAQKDQPVTLVYTQNETAIINDLLMQQRQQTGANYVEKNTALKPCYQALERGEAVALLVDQRVDPGLDVEFFGRLTAISRIPARLAANFNCPIIPFEVVRIKPGHLRVVFQEAILPNGKGDRQAEVKVTQEIANAVQELIIRNADTWFCSKLRWTKADREKILAHKVASGDCSQTNSTSSPAGR